MQIIQIYASDPPTLLPVKLKYTSDTIQPPREKFSDLRITFNMRVFNLDSYSYLIFWHNIILNKDNILKNVNYKTCKMSWYTYNVKPEMIPTCHKFNLYASSRILYMYMYQFIGVLIVVWSNDHSICFDFVIFFISTYL